MGRTLLALALLAAAALHPAVRARLRPVIEPVLGPVHRANAKYEANRIAAFVGREMARTGEKPATQRDYAALLRRVFPNRADVARDPWGSAYVLQRRFDALHVGSPGADRSWGTRDDIVSKPVKVVGR